MNNRLNNHCFLRNYVLNHLNYYYFFLLLHCEFLIKIFSLVKFPGLKGLFSFKYNLALNFHMWWISRNKLIKNLAQLFYIGIFLLKIPKRKPCCFFHLKNILKVSQVKRAQPTKKFDFPSPLLSNFAIRGHNQSGNFQQNYVSVKKFIISFNLFVNFIISIHIFINFISSNILICFIIISSNNYFNFDHH